MKILKPLKMSVFRRKEVIDHGCDETGLIVVFGNKGRGISPLRVLMPHQLYDRHIQEWAEQGWREISVASVGPRVTVAHDTDWIFREEE